MAAGLRRRAPAPPLRRRRPAHARPCPSPALAPLLWEPRGAAAGPGAGAGAAAGPGPAEAGGRWERAAGVDSAAALWGRGRRFR